MFLIILRAKTSFKLTIHITASSSLKHSVHFSTCFLLSIKLLKLSLYLSLYLTNHRPLILATILSQSLFISFSYFFLFDFEQTCKKDVLGLLEIKRWLCDSKVDNQLQLLSSLLIGTSSLQKKLSVVIRRTKMQSLIQQLKYFKLDISRFRYLHRRNVEK